MDLMVEHLLAEVHRCRPSFATTSLDSATYAIKPSSPTYQLRNVEASGVMKSYALRLGTYGWVFGGELLTGLSVDQLRRSHVLHRQPQRLEQRHLLVRLTTGLRS